VDGLQKQVVGGRKMRDMTLQCRSAGRNVGAGALVSLEPWVRANAFTDTMDKIVLPLHALLPKVFFSLISKTENCEAIKPLSALSVSIHVEDTATLTNPRCAISIPFTHLRKNPPPHLHSLDRPPRPSDYC